MSMAGPFDVPSGTRRHATDHAVAGVDPIQDPEGWGIVYTLDPRVPYNSFNALTGGPNLCFYMRHHGAATITKIAGNVGVASGNIGVGAYSNTGAGQASAPNVRRATSGSVACPAAGDATISLIGSAAQVEGDWLALVADNNTVTFIRLYAFATTLSAGVVTSQASAFPPPSPAASSASANAMGFLLVGVP